MHGVTPTDNGWIGTWKVTWSWRIQSKNIRVGVPYDTTPIYQDSMPAPQKNSRKRLPASQGGPAVKKVRIASAKSRDDTVKKRRHPVTLPAKVEDDERDSDEDTAPSGAEDGDVPSEKDEMVIDHAQKDPNGTVSSFAFS